MATLKDISRLTGVSVTQVSRALGGHDDVNAETRNLVLEAARKLGYQPNAMARGLRTGRTGIVALVLSENIDASTREILFEMILGISSEFAKRKLKFILHVNSDGGPKVYEELMNWGGVDGFVLLNPKTDDERIRFLLERGVPFTVHGNDPSQTHLSVDVDNNKIGHDLAQAVLKAGHQHALFINGAHDRTFARARSKGALTCFEAAGAELTISSGPMTRERGFEEASEVLQHPNPPTAMIAGNSMIARGIYDAADTLGFNIPDDLMVVAHDDVLKRYPAEAFDPPLIGTRSQISDAWPAIAQLMESAIENGADSTSGVVLDAPFITQ